MGSFVVDCYIRSRLACDDLTASPLFVSRNIFHYRDGKDAILIGPSKNKNKRYPYHAHVGLPARGKFLLAEVRPRQKNLKGSLPCQCWAVPLLVSEKHSFKLPRKEARRLGHRFVSGWLQKHLGTKWLESFGICPVCQPSALALTAAR